jgi:hypothetical protein
MIPSTPLPTVPWPVALGFALLVLVTVGLLPIALYHAARRQGLEPARGKRLAFGVAAVLLLWMVVTGALALTGFFARFDALPPRILAGTLPPIAAILVALGLPRSRALLLSVPAAWVIGFQIFRVGAELTLLALARAGVVPYAMTFEGSNFDLLTGLTALPVAILLARGTLPRGVAVAWNALGLLLLANVVRIAVLAAPGPLYRLTDDVPNLAPAVFPFVWLPYALVPLALLGHIVSLQQLRAARRMFPLRRADAATVAASK